MTDFRKENLKDAPWIESKASGGKKELIIQFEIHL